MAKLAKLISFVLLVAVTAANSVLDRQISEGYSNGFLTDCPGSSKEARISTKSLKHLKLVVFGEGNALTANKTSYNYHQMRELAKKTDFSKKIAIYMCGYLDSPRFIVSNFIANAYKEQGYTVWLLEYFHFSSVSFPVAARFLRPVGKHVGEMLANLTRLGLNPKKLQLIGISHGGQGISFIAKSYKRLTGSKISRLTSLDPTGSCFRNLGLDQRLDKSDADFVEVIHTNIDGYGMATPMGHVDFYVNGGEYQAADIVVLPCTNECSHVRSQILWITAMKRQDCFIAIQCDSVQNARNRNCYERVPMVTNVLGFKVDKSKQGIFYLPTNYYFPYCMGDSFKGKKDIYQIEMEKLNKEDLMFL